MGDPERYRVGELVIDKGRGRVFRGDAEIALPKLSYDLLLALMRAAPNLLSIDALMEQVWPGLVVNPETVSQRVKLLRDALGDDPKAPTYIAGVRGRGYQLIAPVERFGVSPQNPSASQTPSRDVAPELPLASATPIRRLPPWTWIAATVAVAAIAVASWWLLATHERPTPQSVVVERAPPRSVAVLPFENLGPSQDDRLIALGISEAVLDQLARLDGLLVIARTSSFALEGQRGDARELGNLLNARYLLSGSVQREKEQLRVTAQLVNATDGNQVWSMRFDRRAQDLFSVQDEIAVEVVRALKLSVDSDAIEKLTRRGTGSIEASLAYQQGVDLLNTRKLTDLQAAKQRFAEAIHLDPGFAAAHVALAETHGLELSFTPSEFWFGRMPMLPPESRREADELLATALRLDPDNGEAYFVRGWLNRDFAASEADFRRGTQLSPNNAVFRERFARLLFWFPAADQSPWDAAKREESFAIIDEALHLDPLRSTNHLTKGLMMLYGRSDVGAANTLLLRALERDPNYYPALMRLAELRWCCSGRFAEAIRYGEQALALEPKANWPRHFLVPFYVDIGDIEAARQLAAETQDTDPLVAMSLLIHEGQWRTAAEIARSRHQFVTGLDQSFMNFARIQDVRTGGERQRYRKRLEEALDVKWIAPGKVSLYDEYEVALTLAELMQLDGDRERAAIIVRHVIQRMDREAIELRRGDLWFGMIRPRALALLGDHETALQALRRSLESGFRQRWRARLDDPLFAPSRGDPRFEGLRADLERSVAGERAALESLRSAGVVPRRDATGTYRSPAPRRSAPANDKPTYPSSLTSKD